MINIIMEFSADIYIFLVGKTLVDLAVKNLCSNIFALCSVISRSLTYFAFKADYDWFPYLQISMFLVLVLSSVLTVVLAILVKILLVLTNTDWGLSVLIEIYI